MHVGYALEALCLYLPGCYDAFPYRGAAFCRNVGRYFIEGHRRDFYLNVDAVEQRSGYFIEIFLHGSRRADAFFCGMIIIAAWAWVHGCNEHESCRIVDCVFCARYGYVAVFKRLAHHFEHLAVEFRKLVEKQYSVVGKAYFTRHRICSSAYQCYGGNRVVRRAERALHNGILDPALVASVPEYAQNMMTATGPADARIWFVPDYFMNTVVAGLIYGLAIGMIFKSGATSGGSDIISMIINKYTHMPLGTLVIIVDTTITLSTLFLGQGFRLPIYSILLIVIEGKVIDIVVDGLKTYKTVFIVTNQYEAVRDVIITQMKRGGTHIHAKGLYEGVERDLIYVSLTRRELVTLRNLLSQADPAAFVSVGDASEVMGKGFKSLHQA